MNRLYLMKNPPIFQGETYLNKNKNYFEGWYFKNTNNENGISFIPGINIDEEGKKAFIQVITNKKSYYINYDIDSFKFNVDPFYIQIGDNTFSKDGIHIDIKQTTQSPSIYGDVFYSEKKEIKTNLLNPNIMGPFSYVPFMECNHAILSMKNCTKGSIMINEEKLDFNNGIAYIEKDWGTSFPKAYIWAQGNDFQNKNVSFMLSVANIPFKLFEFRGLICVLIIDNKEFRFTTYNGAKIVEYNVADKLLNITLKKGEYSLNIKSTYDAGLKLAAPIKGKMAKDIFESISSSITVTLKKEEDVIFSDTSNNCGLEIVKE